MIKLIMTWSIRDGKEKEYLEFLTRDLAKSILAMGVQPTDVWYAVWGDGPQVLAGGVTDDLPSMQEALASEEWRTFRKKIADLVIRFDHKVVEASGGFQL